MSCEGRPRGETFVIREGPRRGWGTGRHNGPQRDQSVPPPRRESARERGGSVVRDVQVSPGVVEVTCTYENERELCNAEREVKRASSVDAKNQVCRYVSSL